MSCEFTRFMRVHRCGTSAPSLHTTINSFVCQECNPRTSTTIWTCRRTNRRRGATSPLPPAGLSSGARAGQREVGRPPIDCRRCQDINRATAVDNRYAATRVRRRGGARVLATRPSSHDSLRGAAYRRRGCRDREPACSARTGRPRAGDRTCCWSYDARRPDAAHNRLRSTETAGPSSACIALSRGAAPCDGGVGDVREARVASTSRRCPGNAAAGTSRRGPLRDAQRDTWRRTAAAALAFVPA